MDILVSPTSDTPIYLQIADQITAQILKGELASGTALPPIRSVARQLEISVITVKKAWEELVRGGFIHTIIGKGSFVSTRPQTEWDEKREAMARHRLVHDLPFYQELGLNQDEFIRLAREAYVDPPPSPDPDWKETGTLGM